LRWSLLIVLLAIPTLASARPKLAVAPLDGDKDGNIAEIVADAAADHGKTTRPDKVGREIEKLEIASLNAKTAKKLRIKLEADVVIYGGVEKQGTRKHLELMLTGHGKSKSKLDIDFKTTKALKKELEDKLGKQIDIAAASTDHDGDDDDDEASKRKQREAEERDKKRRDDEEKRRQAEAEKQQAKEKERKRKKHGDDEDRDADDRKHTSKKRTASRDEDSDDDDTSVHRKKKRRHRDDEDDEDDEDDGGAAARPRHPITQAAAWVDLGAAVARRTLTYDATGNQQPPRVGTAAPAGELEGEVYPASFSTLKGPAAAIGIAGAYDRALGLGIAVPNTAIVAPIKSGFYWIGARYRFTFGGSSVAVGASYWRRYYMADRSKLTMPTDLDMPDVDYTALAPDVTARFAATPKLGVFAALQIPLMLSSGPIQSSTSYGPSTIIAFDMRTGVQIGLGAHYALQIALGFDQIGLKFNAKQGSQAALRAVSAATDRSLGLAATLGVMY
jgi:hypothetical protein